MKILGTSRFKKLRKKIKQEIEISALKAAIMRITENPEAGKKLKGEFRELRAFRYSAKGQDRRLIYKAETDTVILFSFGPRERIYK